MRVNPSGLCGLLPLHLMNTSIRHLSGIILMLAAVAAPTEAQVYTAADSSMCVSASSGGTNGIVGRLQSPESGVMVIAPEELLLRASRQAEPDSADFETDDAVDEEEQARAVRTKSGKTVGYRVQIYADNNVRSAKAEARQRERALGQAFPAYDTYVTYASPYWRLRVGDFRSQYDAEKAAAEIRKAFPRYAREVRVVRDRINSPH